MYIHRYTDIRIYNHAHIHAYMLTCMHAQLPANIQPCTRIRTHTHTRTRTRVLIYVPFRHTYIRTYIHTHVHQHLPAQTNIDTPVPHTYLHTYILTCMHAFMHTYLHIHIYTFIQTDAYLLHLHRLIKLFSNNETNKPRNTQAYIHRGSYMHAHI